MTSRASDAASAASNSDEAQAFALWTFVHLRIPRLTSADALHIVRELAPTASDDVKTLATRLQKSLASRGTHMKRSHALEAAARLLGHESWHSAAKQPAASPLQFISAFSQLNRPLSSWKEAIECFCDLCEGDHLGGGMRIYQVGFDRTAVTFDSPLVGTRDAEGRPMPEFRIQWPADAPGQLVAAVAGIETMRRRYEETGKGIVDGLAAAQFCLQNPHNEPQPDDPLNSELVVIEVTPGPSFGDEVARGDEVKCWSELDKVHPKKKSPTYSLDTEVWVVDDSRYQWQLSTVRMQGVAPTVVSRLLSTPESAKLFRRHQLAMRNGLYFLPQDRVKPFRSVAFETHGVDVDWSRVRSEVFGTDPRTPELEAAVAELAQRGRLSVDAFLRLAKLLRIDDSSQLVRKPKRAELVLLRDDELFRAFISRVHDVTYEVPRRLTDGAVKAVDDAVNQLLIALKNDVVMADGVVHDAFPRNDPYMIYANQGKEVIARLKKLGLVAYAGVYTTVTAFRARNGWERNVKSASSYKVERVLFLDIDFAEVA
jgi:hypothetical protein